MKVYELLDKPEKWTKKAFARDILGVETYRTNSDAVCFCLEGALLNCYQNEFDKYCKVINAIYIKVGVRTTEYNDRPETTYEDIIKLCKELDI